MAVQRICYYHYYQYYVYDSAHSPVLVGRRSDDLCYQSPVAWTTVTCCATASPTNWCAACSQFRTLPPVSWWAPGDAIISRLCFVSCTGFLCGSASCSRFWLSSTSHCPATSRVTWSTTFGSSPVSTSDNGVLLTLEYLLLVGREAVLKTGPSPLQNYKSGTVCRPI